MKKITFFLILLFPICANAQLKINEIMTNNVSAVLDDSYNYSMWVELYNPGLSSINQSVYYFTDDLKIPRKWRPASKYIAPGSFGMLWFERDERAGHASFKLDPDGGKLYMLNATVLVVDSVIYPAQKRNVSYGRKTDGANEWVFFEQHNSGVTNNGKKYASLRCAKPVFNLPGGFYSASQNVSFAISLPGDSIYYTRNGSEPTRLNSFLYTPGNLIPITTTTFIRAKSFSAGKLSSDVATATYFINVRESHLPVVSIVTDYVNLIDNTLGIYVVGTNGITGNGSDSPVNFNQDWDRPVNFELFDTAHVSRLNQELDISISGGWSRMNPQKSLKISPRKKFGDNRLRYDIFAASKPNRKYKDIQLRNSGNDFYYSMMRDAFMESIVMNRMDLDYLAYEPAVLFMNGTYYGIQNLRERSSTDYLYSNYGLEEDEVHLIETGAIPSDTSYTPLSNYITQSDITLPSVYNKVCQLMDVDNFINYMISEIYYGNTDWPANNIKIWKKKAGGKWRWILYDTDFGFNLYDTNLYNHNTLLMALGEKTDEVPLAWSTLLMRRLMLNETFRNKFIDRFSIQLSTTFETNRVNQIMDSLAAKISNEIVYHKTKWGSYRSFESDITNMKTFSAYRPDKMLGFISSRFLSATAIQTVKLSSNVGGASYQLNSEPIMDADALLKYFKNRPIVIQANPVAGYKFKQWELNPSTTGSSLVPMGSSWKFYDGSAIPSANWNTNAYSDVPWSVGIAQFGYGGKGEKTLIGYGGNASNKYTTAYFRKTISINNLSSKTDFSLTMLVDDGAAVYVNGQEVGRYFLPTGALAFNTLATTFNNGDRVTFAVPLNLLKEGENVIAVEVHQINVTSSDLIFDLEMTCQTNPEPQVYNNPIYTGTLTGNIDLKAIYEKSIPDNTDTTETVVINELVASNNLISDSFGGKDDYIELYNTGTEDVNIAGWYLTDTPTNRTLSQIPATNSTLSTIPAKGRIILWADDEPVQGVLHLSFKLGKEGEPIILSKINLNGNLVMVDSVSFPAMDTNLSYSRVPDGGDDWLIKGTTYNFSNDGLMGVDSPHTLLSLYPTIVTESFTLQNASGVLLRIIDLTGKVLFQQTCQSEKEVVSTGFLQRGLYVVTVGSKTYKIVKI